MTSGTGWFSETLKSAVVLSTAADDIAYRADRSRVGAAGEARWAPASAAAIGAHLIGGVPLVIAHRNRVRSQAGVTPTP